MCVQYPPSCTCDVYVVCLNLTLYVRDVFRLVGEELAYRELGDDILVLEKCDRGRGTRPR